MATGGQLPRKASAPSGYSLPDVPSDDLRLFEVQSMPDIRPVDLIGSNVLLNRQRGQISVLMLTPWWHFDSYGISSISKSLINDLRLVDSEGANVDILCAVLEEEGKIPQDQQRDAEKQRVQLIGAKQPRGKKRKPELQWLDEDVNKYYQDLIYGNKFDFIVGHIPYLANGTLNLKTLCDKQGHDTKIILVVHALPMTDERGIDEDCLSDWLKEADLVLSVGGNVWMQVASFIKAMDIHVDHELYLPSVTVDVSNLKQSETQPKLSGEQNIMIMVPDGENFEKSGLDFELAVVSSVQASQSIMFNEGSNLSRQLSLNLKLFASTEEGKTVWEESLKAVKEKHKIEGTSPGFKVFCPKRPEKLKPHMKRATLVVLPLKGDSPLFGTETLNALAAGIPILVSKNSGIASYLHERGLSEPVVWDSDGLEKDIRKWKEKLIEKITNPEEALCIAKELRELLQLDLQTASTHRNFIKYITGRLSILQLIFNRICNKVIKKYNFAIIVSSA